MGLLLKICIYKTRTQLATIKMTQTFGLLVTLWSFYSTCIAMPDIHKQMSPLQLQSVFHVDSIDSVPSYELIQLKHLGTHHDDTQLLRRRRSAPANRLADAHHVKKDLSKNPYYSEPKVRAPTANQTANTLSDSNYSDKLKNLDLNSIKEHNVSLSAFGEVMNLTLRPTEGLFKNGPDSLRMWTVRSEPNATHGLALEEVLAENQHAPQEEIGQVFQDEENMAAVLMRRHLQTGDLIMEGSLGHRMVIKPLPMELNPDQDKVHHVIFKRDVEHADHFSDFAFMEPDDIETSNKQKSISSILSAHSSGRTKRSAADKDEASQRSSRTKREAPYMIYPEILVIVDYDGYRLHGGDNLQVKRYFISFWNGVDLRYRLLKGPKIRISIAGIIISRGRDATPYLERNRVGRDAIDSAAALTDMGKYLFRERRLPVYDIAVAITKYDMCRRRKGGRCTKGTAGFAYVGGACVVNKRLEKVNSVAIIEDTGGFSGIIVAAHEVGHLLGAVHDGSPPPSYLGGPGAERCRWEDGYIMSDLRHTERGFRWSTCTVQSFHHFLNGDTATCLHNAPHEDNALGRQLPGTLLSLDAQCRRDRGTYACFKDERVCAQLFCFDAQTGYCVAYRPAAEGSSCGNGVHCLDGRCTPLPSNAIQDYGPQYRVVYNSAEQDFDDKSNEDYYETNDNENEASSLDFTDEFSSSTSFTTASTTTPTTTSTTTSTTTIPEPITTSTTPITTTIATIDKIEKIDDVKPLILYRKLRLRNMRNNKTRTYLKHIKPIQQTTTVTTTTPSSSKPTRTTNSTRNSSTNSNSNSSTTDINSTPSTLANNFSALRKTYDLYYKNFINKSKYHINSNRTSHSQNPPNYSSTTASPPQHLGFANTGVDHVTESNKSPSEVDSNETLDDTVGENQRSYPQLTTTTSRSYALGGRPTTRSSLFDTYFRKRTSYGGNSTKYLSQLQQQHQQHQQQQQLQQQQASPPAYTTNYLGDNTNNFPINIPRDRSSRSSRS